MTISRAIAVSAMTLATTFTSQALAGGSIDLSLANDKFRIAYDATDASSGLHINAAWLHHEDDGDMLSAGLHVVDTRPGQRNLFIGVGVNLALFHTDWEDGGGVGVGGFFRYSFPAMRDLGVAGYVYYTPSVLAFSDTKNMINSDIRLQYSVIPTARIYAGYRYVALKMEDVRGRYELGDGFHVGATIDF